MNTKDIRDAYFIFFEARGHKLVPSGSLIPEDTTTLLTSAGMQPMLPYLLGKKHPLGSRIVDSQRCLRSQDIMEVGDNRHQTFFEMLGNWSFGDYFKEEQLSWIFEFLMELGLDPNRLYVTAFVGDPENNLPKDEETVGIWKRLFKSKGIEAKDIELGSMENASKVGMKDGRIFYYTTSKNWWSRSGEPGQMPEGEPGGPDSELFYLFDSIPHDPKFGENCHPNCDCGRFLEFGNSVFMQYQKQSDGSFKELPNKNVDFGGGLERVTACVNDNPDVFEVDLFTSIIKTIEEVTGQKYSDPYQKPYMRMISDHLKAATFLVIDGVRPSNKLQGYILRRLIRRAIVKLHQLAGKDPTVEGIEKILESVLVTYHGVQEVDKNIYQRVVFEVVGTEAKRFLTNLTLGLQALDKAGKINGKIAFDIYQSFGFPFELMEELLKEKGLSLSKEEFEEEFKKHQELSRIGPT